MKISQAALSLVLCIGLIRSTRCEDADPIRVRTDKAKATYERELDRARTAVLDKFTEREDAARNKGDIKAVKEIQRQRAAFEVSDDIQKYFTPQIRASLVEANKALDAVYTSALKDYLRAKKDDEASKLQAEYEIVKVQLAPVEVPKPVAKKPEPLIAAGMVFEGSGENRGGGKTHKLTEVLTIESIEDTKVTGTIVGKPTGQNTKFVGVISKSNGLVIQWENGSRVDKCVFQTDGSALYTWQEGKRIGTYNLLRTFPSLNGNGTSTAVVSQNDPAYESVPEVRKPTETIATTTITGQLYPSKGGNFMDSNLIIMCVDGTEGKNKKRLLDFTRGRDVIQLIATEPRFAFPLKDGADKRVQATVTGRLEGSNRLWLSEEPHEINRPKAPGLSRP